MFPSDKCLFVHRFANNVLSVGGLVLCICHAGCAWICNHIRLSCTMAHQSTVAAEAGSVRKKDRETRGNWLKACCFWITCENMKGTGINKKYSNTQLLYPSDYSKAVKILQHSQKHSNPPHWCQILNLSVIRSLRCTWKVGFRSNYLILNIHN